MSCPSSSFCAEVDEPFPSALWNRYTWSMMRRLLIASGLLVLPSVLALTLTLADAGVRRERIHVSP